MYDRLLAQDAESAVAAVTTGVATTQISPESENSRLPELQHAPADRVRNGKGRDEMQQSESLLHPDLQELNFGPLGASSNNLPPPIRPSTSRYNDSDRNLRTYDARGSLSDFSDYNSSEEEEDPLRRFSSQTRNRKVYSDGSDDDTVGSRTTKFRTEDDPFADPFADEAAPVLSTTRK
jgi:LAS seventeen-binding protein 5